MKPERYDVLASSPVRWTYEAHRQRLIGRMLIPFEGAIWARLLKAQRPLAPSDLQDIQQLRAVGGAGMLHFGPAIENAYKARRFSDGAAIAEGGRMKHIRTDHDILGMVRDYRIAVDETEIDRLRSVTFAVKSVGKYPLAKDIKRQEEFTGRTAGPYLITPLADRICMEMLRDDVLVSIFQHGAISGTPDTA